MRLCSILGCHSFVGKTVLNLIMCGRHVLFKLCIFVFQSFPQAVLYNRETRVFELRSDAERRLARQLKTAVRLGRKRNSELYRAVHSNSFSPIPLIPITTASPEVKRLSAIYTVQVMS